MRYGDFSANRRDDADSSAAALAHLRQDFERWVDHAPAHPIPRFLEIGEAQVLDRSDHDLTRVIHQNIDLAVLPRHFSNHLPDAGGIGYVAPRDNDGGAISFEAGL